MKPALVLAACIAAVPAVIASSAVVTTIYYERIYLPRIAGED